MKKNPFIFLLMLRGVSGFGAMSSAFTRSLAPASTRRMMSGNMVMYDSCKDPPSSSGDTNMWSVLANTEKWISTILGKPDSSNPYTRKEVSYLCELSNEDALIVAGIWRRLRESREQGEAHGKREEHRLVEHEGEPYDPPTFRQTNVMVIPNDTNLKDFQIFDSLVDTINKCRRNSRDFLLDANVERLEDDARERDWSVSVNCAHLHPNFGSDTLTDDDEEEDEKIKLYKQKRLLARRSPYPTLCIEVRATPPLDFSSPPPPPHPTAAASLKEDQVTGKDVQKLEALFGKAATFTKEPTEDSFFNAISDCVEEVSIVSPLIQAQNWIAENHNEFDITTSTFTSSDSQMVDAGYEFAFNNLAMQEAAATTASAQYVVYSNFMSASATSFEKFSRAINELIGLMPSLANRVSVSTLHPEHVDESSRAPVPVLVMNWATADEGWL